MSAWNCCRTCLSTATLSPIFSQEEYSEHYTNVIFIATGVKVENNDNLPQQICNPCITIINDIMKFRKKCDLAQTTLLNHSNLTEPIKQEHKTEILTIDISDYIDDDFKDYDDNIALNTLQYSEMEKLEIKNSVKFTETHKLENKDSVEFTETDKLENKDIAQYIETEKSEDNKVSNNVYEKVKEKVIFKGKKEKAKRTKKKDGEKVKEEIECEYCHKVLTSKLSIRNHYKIHTGFDVVCEHCGKKFITRRLLLMHCRAKHGYEKTDKCSYCDYRASNAEQVKIHERLHTGEKPYVCAECGAGFHRNSSYLQHVAIHLPDKTVPCTLCPARFKSVTLMRIHAARHRAPRYSYQCALCENSFARRRNVARHVQRIHGMPAEPQTICRRKIT